MTATVDATEPTVLEATAPGGAALTLTIPPGALLPGIEVRMTPIESLSGLPGGFELEGGVMLEPEGMWLARPAMLEIVTPTGEETDSVPLVLDGSASAAEAYLGRFESSTIIAVDHFSGVARGSFVGPADPMNWTPSSSIARAVQALHRLAGLAQSGPDTTPSLVAGYWRSIHQVNIVPLLAEAATLASRAETTADAIHLTAILAVVHRWASFPPNEEWTPADRDLAETVLQQLLEALRVAVARTLDRCNDRHDLEALAFLMLWQAAVSQFGWSLPADAAALRTCLSFEFRLTSTMEGRQGDFIRLGLHGAVPLTVGLNPSSEAGFGTAFTFNAGAGPLRYVEASSSIFPALGACGQQGHVSGGNDTTMTVPKWTLAYNMLAPAGGGPARFAFTEATVDYELGSPTENVQMCGGTYQFEPGLFDQWYSDLHSLELFEGTFHETNWQGERSESEVIGRVNYQRSGTVAFVLKATYPGDEGDDVSASVEEDTVLELVHGTQ